MTEQNTFNINIDNFTLDDLIEAERAFGFTMASLREMARAGIDGLDFTTIAAIAFLVARATGSSVTSEEIKKTGFGDLTRILERGLQMSSEASEVDPI